MATACIAQVTFGFEPKGKPVVARFDQPHASSDGGAVLLKSLDTQLQLTKRLAGCLVDARQPGKVQHQTAGVGAAARLRARLWLRRLQRRRAAGRRCDPQAAARPRSARRAGPWPRSRPCRGSRTRWAWAPVARHGARAGRHRDRAPSAAAQGPRHADHDRPRPHRRPDPRPAGVHASSTATTTRWCYLPLVATVTFNDEPEQYAVAAVLRPGNAPATRGARGAPAAPAGQAARRLSRRRRFGCGWMGALPARSCSSSWSSSRSSTSWRWPAIARLEKRARRLMGKARMRSKATGADGAPVRRDAVRRAEWKRKRRVIIKAEVVRHPGRDPKNNPRFVVTNLPDAAGGGLPVLLRAGRRGEPAQGAASRAGDGPDQLLAVPGQPVPGPADRWPRTSCSRTCGAGPRARPVPTRRSPRCASGCSSSRCGSSARCGGSCCTCPPTFPWLPTWQQLARAVGAKT